MTIKYKRWYEWREMPWRAIYHTWCLVGPRGAVHVHISESKDYTPSGGIECHWNEYRPEFGRAPDHLECEMTKRPCWHDGSSLFVSERIIPALNLACLRQTDHEFVFSHCRDWYEEKIEAPGGEP